MNSRTEMDRRQVLRNRETRMQIPKRGLTTNWRKMLRRHPRMHDPLLVLNMSVFNFDDGWSRTFNPFKVHGNGAR